VGGGGGGGVNFVDFIFLKNVLIFQLHTSSPVQGSLTIPERLRGIPEAEDPGFFEMVEYFFHKAHFSFSSLQLPISGTKLRSRSIIPV
jgi:hypothetical protein